MDTNEMDPHSPWQLKVFFCFVFALLQIPKPLGSIIDFSSLACAFPAFILLSFGHNIFAASLCISCVPFVMFSGFFNFVFHSSGCCFSSLCPFRPNYFGWGSTCMQRICHIYTQICEYVYKARLSLERLLPAAVVAQLPTLCGTHAAAVLFSSHFLLFFSRECACVVVSRATQSKANVE